MEEFKTEEPAPSDPIQVQSSQVMPRNDKAKNKKRDHARENESIHNLRAP